LHKVPPSDLAEAKPYQRAENGVVLFVRLTPKSSRDQIESVSRLDQRHCIIARVRAVPEKGKANHALCALVADWLSARPSGVSVRAGGKSRVKQVWIEGDADALTARLDALIAALNENKK